MTSPVTLSSTDTHTLLTLDDGKANALSFDMFEALDSALDEAAAAGKVLVIAGRPGRFSAGFDLNVMGRADESTLRLLKKGADLSLRLLSFDTPVVLAVTGHALAMGALLCLSADYRVGTSGEYKIGLNEVAIGMTMPWFGVELARHRLAPSQFETRVGLAALCDPQTAVAAGFLDEAVEDTVLMPRVEALAAQLAQLDMAAHRGSKARIRELLFERLKLAMTRDFDAGL